MNNRNKNIITTVLFAVLIFGISALCILRPAAIFSESERRELASFPEFSIEAVANGDFVEGFETYATERFPYRDFFRSVKAAFSTKFLNKLDNNGLFTADGHISKIDSKINPEMMKHSAERFMYLYDTYLKGKGMDIYLSIIPDKNYFLADKNGYPSLDYDAFTEEMKAKLEYMNYIDVTDLLELDDYYRTDTHWKQENITDIAGKLLKEMGTHISPEYTENTLENPFYGVYSGQLAMPFEPDEIKYLTNSTIDEFDVTYYDTGMPKAGEIYNMEKANGKDPYEMYLSGTTPLVTIENPNSKHDKELIIFRDSFGSSLAPLLAEGYRKTTVIDIRYIQSDYLGNFVGFDNEDTDVLFVYSTTLLNNSLAMR